MTKESRLPLYLPYPRFLLEDNIKDMTQTAKLLYLLLIDRATLSQKNNLTDEQGRLYVIFPIEKLAAVIGRSHMTVKNALKELETADLIERRRQGFSASNRIYVKLPDGQETVRLTERKSSLSGKENYPPDRQKSFPATDRNLSPNNLSINNKSFNNLNGAREAPAAYGRYGNVFLSSNEYEELKEEIPDMDRLVNELSGYMKANGKQYADHAATIWRWYEREKPKRGIPDYTCREGESL